MGQEHTEFIRHMLENAKKKYDEPQQHVHIQPEPAPEIEPQKPMDEQDLKAVESYMEKLKEKIQRDQL